MKMGGLCFNWKVVAGLAAVGVGIWVLAPNLVGAALPLLLVAACPLSMLFMMRGMGGGQCASRAQQAKQPIGAVLTPRAGLTRDEQLAEMKERATALQARHQAIASQIARLEADGSVAVREAEVVARSADERARAWPDLYPDDGTPAEAVVRAAGEGARG